MGNEQPNGKNGSARPIIVGTVVALALMYASTLEAVHKVSENPMLASLRLDLSVVLMQIGVVLLLFPLIKALFIKPLHEAMDARTKSLEDTYAEADSLKERMENLKSDYEKRLETSEAEAREKIQTALSDAQKMREQIVGEAKTQAEQLTERTKEDLSRERDKMLVDLRSHVVDMTLDATERLIGKSMDEGKQRELVSEFIDKAEVGS